MAAQKMKLTQLALKSPDYIGTAVDDAVAADLEATARVEEVQNSVTFIPPTIPYDCGMSKSLI